MSVAQVKNLQRRLDNLAREAETELNRACGHELWQSVGFDAFQSGEADHRGQQESIAGIGYDVECYCHRVTGPIAAKRGSVAVALW